MWNAARFCQANGIGASAAIEPPPAALPVNRWIVGETVKTVQALDLALAEFRFDEAANTLYHFVWDRFCDWYLELIKPYLTLGAGANELLDRPREETRVVAGWALDQILVMLHPFMPFVTEELWNALGERSRPLILANWPMPDARALDAEAAEEIEWLIPLISGFRSFRSEYQIPFNVLEVKLAEGSDRDCKLIEKYEPQIRRLAGLNRILVQFGSGGIQKNDFASDVPISFQGGRAVKSTDTAQISIGATLWLTSLDGIIDVAGERERLAKAVAAAEKERDSLAARLANPAFVERAKPEAVEKARADHAEKAGEAARYRAALARLG